MTDIKNLQYYTEEIEKILAHKDTLAAKRLFDHYLSFHESKGKEGFVLSLIGMVVSMDRQPTP